VDRGRSRTPGLGALLTGDLFPVDEVDEPRRVVLHGVQVSYVLSRSRKRRRIAFIVDEHGLSVRAPWSAPPSAIETALHATSRWILRKLDEWSRRTPAPRLAWRSGDSIDYLGQPVTLEVVEDRLLPITELATDRMLRVGVPPAATPKQVRGAVVTWYRRHARRHFPERVIHYATTLGVDYPRVLVSDASTRWGSCNARREVRLNWRLMQAAPHLIDYVVAHEVAHLLHLNHSARFWGVVERLYPDYDRARAELSGVSGRYMGL
jgi:predicted metal-dependent hydrolase